MENPLSVQDANLPGIPMDAIAEEEMPFPQLSIID